MPCTTYDVYRVRPCIASARRRSRFSRLSLEGMALTVIVVHDCHPRESSEREVHPSCGELSQAHGGLEMVIVAPAFAVVVHLTREVIPMPRTGQPGVA